MTHYYTDNSNLVSKRKNFDYYFDNEKFNFTTDNGVFSKGNIDYGSYLLIKNTYQKELGKNVLDLGCGYGPVGTIIKRFNPSLDVTAIDINPRAIELAKINSSLNKTKLNIHLCENILTLNILFDSIILNPPVRAGKSVIYDLYEKSYETLNNDGSLYIVIQRKHGADSHVKKLSELFKQIITLDKNGGYHVIQAIK